jgi:hypothetical protein
VWAFDGGRDDWIRTSDPYVPNVVRYRTALHPDWGCKFTKPGAFLSVEM